ncbi:single-stranded DNA-binding protein [Intestinibacter bartlettii]|uniref:Single-stranded DNA-binding protein n=1 Tax=Intestinibacter bartlettii TaxID=261299 RepID=A0ABS6DZK2_9FIRM|nr:single-stranded DNA-binding protein [Intestinibacter bartlettii]MBU5337268.1 single-stranded DNA-binding protein [Intestinibacter bartlettii]
MNSITLIGRLTADPDLRFINTGTAISKFTIAIDRSYRKDNQAVTDFIPVEIWGKKAEYCATYIEKGCLVAVSGSLHIDRFIDSSGNNRNYAKVVANTIMKLNSPNKSDSSSSGDTNSGGIDNTDGNTNADNVDNNTGDNSNTSGNLSANKNANGDTANASTANNDPVSNFTVCADDDLPF